MCFSLNGKIILIIFMPLNYSQDEKALIYYSNLSEELVYNDFISANTE